MSLAYLSGFAKWEGFDILPFSFYARFALGVPGGGGANFLFQRPCLWAMERMIHLFFFGEMLSRSYGTSVVSVGERRDFSHSLTVIPPPDGLSTCARRVGKNWSGAKPTGTGREAGPTAAALTGLD